MQDSLNSLDVLLHNVYLRELECSVSVIRKACAHTACDNAAARQIPRDSPRAVVKLLTVVALCSPSLDGQ